MRRPSLVALLALSALAAPASAQQPAAASKEVAGSGGQQALAVRADASGLHARACASSPCSADGGALVPVPEDLRASLPRARLTPIELSGGHALLRVDVPGSSEGSTWVALVAAPLSGKGSDPLVLWSGFTGLPRGDIGEEKGAAVLEEPAPKGGHRVLIGERRADVTLCGRPAVVAAREVNGQTLALEGRAAVQNLGLEERQKAVKLSAVRAAAPPGPAPAARLLRATVASSAIDKRFATLTDGDAATSWSEAKAGEGRGEFVSLGSAEEVGITSLDLVVKPTGDAKDLDPEGAAPRSFFLATEDRVLSVTMPEDAWKKPGGSRYTVKLPAPLHARCLAVVLDEAYARPGGAGGNPHVTLSEIEAHTDFDGASPEALVGALAGGSARSKAAAALLARTGKPGIAAALKGFDKLDEAGRRLAAGVVDEAPCVDQVPFFAERLVASLAPDRPAAAPGEIDPELSHARDRLRRCGRASAPALAQIITSGPPKARLLAAEELAATAPGEAIAPLLDALGKADDAARRDLRAALARAAQSSRAASALREAVAPAALDKRSEVVVLDLLRAIGPSLPGVEGSPAAFARFAVPSASFRTRYLLQAPAAELARGGDAVAAAYLRGALTKDPDLHVRAHAAEVAGKVPALAPDLLVAIDDPEVRVREAALSSLVLAREHGAPPPPGLAQALGRRLASDDWTLVRAGAARALGSMPAEPAVDQALAAALGDLSPDVRVNILDALGAHKAKAQADAIFAHAGIEEHIEVRAHAILALAVLCDARAASEWTKAALLSKTPADEGDRRIGGAAIAALGELHPKDLAERLAPLLTKDTPPFVREMAKAAIANPGSCPK